MALKNLPDVVVVGGGMSGFAAAMAAAGDGRNVVVVDKSSIIGGNATNANVGTICGAYYRAATQLPIAVGYDFCKGFYKKALQLQGLESPIKYHNGLWVIPYDWAQLQTLLNTEFAKAGITYLPRTQVTGVNIDNNIIESLSLENEGHQFTIATKAVVDCSGSAVISRLAGLATLTSAQYQAASQVFRVSGVTVGNEFAFDMALKRSTARILVQYTDLPRCFATISVVPGSLRQGVADIKVVLPYAITDESILGELIIEQAERWVNILFNRLEKDDGALSGAHLDLIYPSPGIRVVQRAKGMVILEEYDVLNCLKTDDEIAIGVWPIEEWGSDGRVKMDYFAENDSYSIPAGCLLSTEINNLFFGGKNISATTRAIGSARVIGTCLQTGYAVGKLAVCTNDDQRTKCIIELNKELRAK